MTAEQVRQVMNEYVKDDRMAIVVVAPADAVRGQLERLGEVLVVPMPSARTPEAGPAPGVGEHLRPMTRPVTRPTTEDPPPAKKAA